MLITNAEALEVLEKVDTLVVDKTGTLTEGKPRLASVVAGAGIDEAELLRLAASLERGSEHPLAAAIVARRRRSAASRCAAATDFRVASPARACAARSTGRAVALGNRALLAELGVDAGALAGARRRAARATGRP